MGLREYKRKRHFDRTPEPHGKTATRKGMAFVVQKHAARNLHYDFRLELDGVLKSWAVPKGPSLDPQVKRLAMQVEDHPVAYGSFEGIIPLGEYGGGTVMLWDRGRWEPVGDARDGFRNGRLKFILHGDKLHGAWMLVRSSSRKFGDDQRRHWLLFKERDAEARPTDEGDVIEDMPRSVATGRSLEEIAAASDNVWRSNRASSSAAKSRAAPPKPAPRRRAKTAAAKSGNGNYDPRKEEFAGVRLTSPDKVLYAEQGITKLELAAYYESIADRMLPHLADRPIVLVRCPEGRAKECFYQKHPGKGTPDVLRQIPVREKRRTEPYVVVDNAASLIALAQISALEVHAWGSRADRLEFPDRLIFDLDPAEDVAWDFVVQSARKVRDFLHYLGLESFVKTTGGKGLHVVVPIERRHTWDQAKDFCKNVADLIVQADPEHYTANMSKAVRRGKIFVDYLRNGRGATAIVAYSPRARPGAPVSAPLAWEELSPRVRSDHYTIRNLARRLARLKRDPWKEIFSVRQSLAGAMKKVRELAG
jgi:bifunctional non-homologous end joining protein LigD